MGREVGYRPPDGQPVPQEPESTTGAPIPFPPNFSFPFFRLPPEVRDKIYRFLHRTHVPVYPTVATSRRVPKRTSFPTNFLRTSVQIEAEAGAVLWGENQIVFQFPVELDTFIPKQKYLQRIRNLVVEVYLHRETHKKTSADRLPSLATAVKRELPKFCDSIGIDHHLHNVEVRFTNVKTHKHPKSNFASWEPFKHYSEAPQPLLKCCFSTTNNGFGRTGLTIDELECLCRRSIETDQQVLLSLAALRSIPNVAVVGRVTPEWSAYLQVCMSSEPGTTLEPFVP